MLRKCVDDLKTHYYPALAFMMTDFVHAKEMKKWLETA